MRKGSCRGISWECGRGYSQNENSVGDLSKRIVIFESNSLNFITIVSRTYYFEVYYANAINHTLNYTEIFPDHIH